MFLKLGNYTIWRSVIKFGVLCRDRRSRFLLYFGASKVQNLRFFRFFGMGTKIWEQQTVFVVIFYRGLCGGSMGFEIEVIRLLVRELWFFEYFLYLENYVVACFFGFEFSFDHYETRDSGILAYNNSKRVHGRSTYDHYFTRNLRSKKLNNALSYFSYNHTFPYGIRPFNVLSNNYFELFELF